MKTFVIHGSDSKIIRRVIVSDTMQLNSIPLLEGEGVIEVPFESYSAFNHAAMAEYVAQEIGEPKHDGRCVEVDKSGKVVAIINADPLIDKPTLSDENTIEMNKTAIIGDEKVDGAFPEKPVVEVPVRELPVLSSEDQILLDKSKQK